MCTATNREFVHAARTTYIYMRIIIINALTYAYKFCALANRSMCVCEPVFVYTYIYYDVCNGFCALWKEEKEKQAIQDEMHCKELNTTIIIGAQCLLTITTTAYSKRSEGIYSFANRACFCSINLIVFLTSIALFPAGFLFCICWLLDMLMVYHSKYSKTKCGSTTFYNASANANSRIRGANTHTRTNTMTTAKSSQSVIKVTAAAAIQSFVLLFVLL